MEHRVQLLYSELISHQWHQYQVFRFRGVRIQMFKLIKQVLSMEIPDLFYNYAGTPLNATLAGTGARYINNGTVAAGF